MRRLLKKTLQASFPIAASSAVQVAMERHDPDKLPTLHLLGLPHTVTHPTWSHCAFTGKVLRFAPMMRPLGYRVVHYGNEGSTPEADEHVDVLSRERLEGFVGKHDPSSPSFVGHHAAADSPLYAAFNTRLHTLLAERVKPWDIVCFPFGHAHEATLQGPFAEVIARAFWVETGIGYRVTFSPLRIYESSAWMHWHHGLRGETDGNNYEWVIPNFYDLRDWTPRYQHQPGDAYVYLGRLGETKGLHEIVALAHARQDIQIVVCGQGDPAPYLTASNIRYQTPLHGRARSAFLANAKAVLCPSKFIEPFCGVAVEAQLCGTPVLSSAYGAFHETIEHGVTGYRCHTLGDWMAGVDRVLDLDRRAIRQRALRYDMHRIAPLYDAAFRQIVDRRDLGWNSPVAHTPGLRRAPSAKREKPLL